MLIPFGVLSAAGVSEGGPTYELIESVVLGTATSSVTFSSLATYASTYKHLQIRLAARTDRTTLAYDFMRLRFNGDTGTNYRSHFLYGNGASVVSEAGGAGDAILLFRAGANAATNVYGGIVLDVLDAYSSTKNTTIRALGGITGVNNEVALTSGLYNNTASITSVFIGPGGGTNFTAGSRFSLYGIRG